MNRIELIQALLPLLYDWSKTTKEVVGSYGGKHDVEKLIDFYITNDEFIEACVGLRIPHMEGHPNYVFYMKRRFDTTLYRNRITERPKGYYKKKWQVYLDAKEKSNDIVNNLIENVEGETRFQRLASVVGHHP